MLLIGAGCHSAAEPTTDPIAPLTTNAVFVVNGEDATLSVIDATTDEVVGTIALHGAAYPHHMSLSADRSTLLLAVPGFDLSEGHTGGDHEGHGAGAWVLLLDASTGGLVGASGLEAPNHNAAWSPDGSAIWTAEMTSPGAVLLLDPVTLEVQRSVPVGYDPAEVTFAAGRAFVANGGSDTVSVLDAATGDPIDTVVVGDNPVGAWPGADGRLYVDNEVGQSITVIDPETLAVLGTFDLGFTPAIAALAPGGELWVTDTDAGQLVFLDPTDGTRLGALPTGAGAHAVVFSPDGGKAWVTNQSAASVSVIDVVSKTVAATIPVGNKPNGLVYRLR